MFAIDKHTLDKYIFLVLGHTYKVQVRNRGKFISIKLVLQEAEKKHICHRILSIKREMPLCCDIQSNAVIFYTTFLVLVIQKIGIVCFILKRLQIIVLEVFVRNRKKNIHLIKKCQNLNLYNC
jgi:hypothetical protein